MDSKIKKLIKRVEFKITFYFALTVFLIVFIVGLLNNVDFIHILKRLIVAELVFIPLGLGVGYILNMVVFAQIGDKFKVDNTNIVQETYNTSTQPNVSEIKDKDSEPNVAGKGSDYEENISEEVVDELDGVDLEAEDDSNMNKDINIGNDDISKYDETENENESLAEEFNKVKNIGKETLGKYIIVNDKKIINDPEVIAKAVRTMMNRE